LFALVTVETGSGDRKPRKSASSSVNSIATSVTAEKRIVTVIVCVAAAAYCVDSV